MIALGKHLRRHEQPPGGGLAFRRDCPICRQERAAGPLPDSRVISPSARVTFAIGSMLAGGFVPSGIAVADRGGGAAEGVAVEAPPALAPPGRDAPSPEALGAGAAPVEVRERGSDSGQGGGGRDPAAEPSATDGPREPAARTDKTPAADRDDDDKPAPRPSAASPTTTVPPPQPPAPSGDEPTARPGLDDPSPESATPAPPQSRIPAMTGAAVPPPSSHADESQATEPARTGAGSRAATNHFSPATGGASTERSSSTVDAEPTGDTSLQRGTYVVQKGDCLWRVAAGQLGEDANDAAIAKEVTRLWKLNAKRIGTDDPDLIYPGQRLSI